MDKVFREQLVLRRYNRSCNNHPIPKCNVLLKGVISGKFAYDKWYHLWNKLRDLYVSGIMTRIS